MDASSQRGFNTGGALRRVSVSGDVVTVAAEAGVTRSHFRRVLRVSFLAPDIVQSILRNRHPIELNAELLAKNTVLSPAWYKQRKRLGFE